MWLGGPVCSWACGKVGVLLVAGNSCTWPHPSGSPDLFIPSHHLSFLDSLTFPSTDKRLREGRRLYGHCPQADLVTLIFFSLFLLPFPSPFLPPTLSDVLFTGTADGQILKLDKNEIEVIAKLGSGPCSKLSTVPLVSLPVPQKGTCRPCWGFPLAVGSHSEKEYYLPPFPMQRARLGCLWSPKAVNVASLFLHESQPLPRAEICRCIWVRMC